MRCHLASLARLGPAVFALSLLAACASRPSAPPTPIEPVVPPLEQFMSEAAQSRLSGARQQEREQYRKAAQAYPTSKEIGRAHV